MTIYILPALFSFALCHLAYRQGRAYERRLVEPQKVLLIRKNVLEQTAGKTLEQIEQMRIQAERVHNRLYGSAR